MTAAHHRSTTEWAIHVVEARKAGLEEPVIAAIEAQRSIPEGRSESAQRFNHPQNLRVRTSNTVAYPSESSPSASCRDCTPGLPHVLRNADVRARHCLRHRVLTGVCANDAVMIQFVHELLTTTAVTDGTYALAEDTLGPTAVVELVAIVGYYSYVAMTLNVFQIKP